MTKWLQSGLRRDVCIVLAGESDLHGQQLKSRIAEHYDERIEPSTFYGALESLVDTGHVAVHEEGIHDAYALTDAGRSMVENQFEWMRDHLEA
ncbi:PadR family transcriptional regulator [Salinarchaeum chitinilyticum]